MEENREFVICFRNNESMSDAVCSASTGLVNDKELPMNSTEGLCCCQGKIDLHLFCINSRHSLNYTVSP